ncbi:fMet-Leu-Phe receptor [Biomphalaria glabrata]|nr:fMet-Leu-Phe receptor-like [Biomphalaria glabrata]
MASRHNETLSPWDISDETRDLFQLINGVYLATIISILGILGNMVNILVFHRQGLRSPINISFMMLALSDLCSLLTLLWYNICGNSSVIHSDSVFFFPEVKHLTAGFPHGCFSRISAWVTVFILTERCVCLAFPLTVKNIVTPKRTVIMIGVVYLVMIMSLVPIYYTKYLDWKWYPELNESRIGMVMLEGSQELDGVSSSLYSSYMISAFLAVTAMTFLLLLLYKSQTQWRLDNVKGTKFKEKMAGRDGTIVKIVLVEGFLFTVTYSASALVLLINILEPEFSYVGRLSNLYFAAFSVSFLLDDINSSLHIVLYFKMSSNFRAAFFDLFDIRRVLKNWN